ncbi:MAG: hypothetical protein M0R77_02970 [Gammaproteobacteria bacterium]|nr:hypothetical protein [Gammaproteobacteria bacterium]
MINFISKRRKWRFLKLGHIKYGSEFHTLVANNLEKQEIDQLLYKSSINTNLVHSVKQVKYIFPDKLTEDEISTKTVDIELEETWTIFFFDELDWTQIQILR